MNGVTQAELTSRLNRLAPRFLELLPIVADLHSFRLVIVPPDEPKRQPLRLLLNAVHDHALAEHLPHLVTAAGSLLVEALRGSEFSGDPDELPEFLVAQRQFEQTFHLGATGKTVVEIQAEKRLREAVAAYFDQQLAAGVWDDSTPAEMIRQQTRSFVTAELADVPLTPAPRTSFVGRCLKLIDLLATFLFFPVIGALGAEITKAIRRISSKPKRLLTWLAYAVWWLYGKIFTSLALFGFRLLELVEPDIVAPAPDPEKLQRLEAGEDLRLKNEVTLWFPVRNTWIRRLLLALILFGSERGCRHIWTDGRLAGIDTIHYARLLQVDNGRTLVFMSDYDGSLNRYLDDFIGVGSTAVIPISANVEGCPKTRWLYSQADVDTFGPRWKNLIRLHQLETSVWYSAYPTLTVQDILANGAIRDGLVAAQLSEAEASRWARRF